MLKNSIIHRRQLLKLGLLYFLHSPVKNLLEQYKISAISKRAIPSSKELIPTVGLGTWRVFNVNPLTNEAKGLKEVLNTLLKISSGSMIDSSPMYGYSEHCIGTLAEQFNQRRSFFFASKVWTTGKSDGLDQINESFKKFRTQQMDLMQVHNLVDVQTQLKTLFELKGQGKVRYVGITHYMPSAYSDMIRIMKNQKIDFVQFNYNVKVRDAEKELLSFARDKGIAVIINRPFEEGQLFNLVREKSFLTGPVIIKLNPGHNIS